MREKLSKCMELCDLIEEKDKATALFFRSHLENYFNFGKDKYYFYLTGFINALCFSGFIPEQLRFDAVEELINY